MRTVLHLTECERSHPSNRVQVGVPTAVDRQLQGARAPWHWAQRGQRIPVVLECLLSLWRLFLPPCMNGQLRGRRSWGGVRLQSLQSVAGPLLQRTANALSNNDDIVSWCKMAYLFWCTLNSSMPSELQAFSREPSIGHDTTTNNDIGLFLSLVERATYLRCLALQC